MTVDGNFKIDLVYLWCDGNDENFIKERNFWANKLGVENLVCNNDCRFIDNNELKYSLRSAEMYAPWINKIFIVTNGQIPQWLDINHPKIKIVTHSEIMPKEYLPTFNSDVIESFIPFIPDLSEYFLYANDDMFFAAPVKPQDFFDENGKPIIRLSPYTWSETLINTNTYVHNIIYCQNLCYNKFGTTYNYEPHHNIDAYRKSYWLECLNEFEKEFEKLRNEKFRTFDLVQRVLVSYYTIIKYATSLEIYKAWSNTQNLSCVCNINTSITISQNTKLLCLNDTETVIDTDRKKAKKFMQHLFNIIAPWEKEADIQISPCSEHKNALVFSFNDSYSKYFSVALQSLIDNSSLDKTYDIIVLYTEISQLNQQKLKNMCPQNFTLRFIEIGDFIDSKICNKLSVRSYWDISTYYRLFIPFLMKEYKKVLYCDSDIIFNANIDDLFNQNTNEQEIVAIRDSLAMIYQTRSERNHQILNDLKLTSVENYFNAGIVLFNIEHLNIASYENRLVQAFKIPELPFQDQDILNFIFKGSVKYISWHWNFQYHVIHVYPRLEYLFNKRSDIKYEAARKNAKIIHYTGFQKPWHSPYLELAEIFWKYARKTPFYEEIIYSNCKDLIKQSKNSGQKCYSFLEHFVSKKEKTKWNGNRVVHYRLFGVSLFKSVQKPGKNKHYYLFGIRVA